MSDVDKSSFPAPNPEAALPAPGVTETQIPHSGKLGLEQPVREFDNTSLSQASESGLITTPDSPAALEAPAPKKSRAPKIFAAAAAVAAVGAGAFALGNKSGGSEADTTERPAATAAPSPTAQPETNPGAPVVIPATEAPAPATPSEGEEAPVAEQEPGAPVFNGYVPSVTDFYGYEYLTEENMKLYESPQLRAAAEGYSLGFVHVGYEEYNQDGPMVGDFAWRFLYPNQYVDTSRLGAEVSLSTTTLQDLAPVYMHNYIMAYNTSRPDIIKSEGGMNDGGTEDYPDILILPVEETYTQQPQVTENAGIATLEFVNVPIYAAQVEKIKPLDASGTSPDDWTMQNLTLFIDLQTGDVVGGRHTAEVNSNIPQ